MTLVPISLNEIPLQGGKENIFSAEVTLRTLYNTFKLSLRRFYYSISLQEYRWETRDYITAGFGPVKMASGQIKSQTKPLESKLIASPNICLQVCMVYSKARGFITQSEADFFVNDECYKRNSGISVPDWSKGDETHYKACFLAWIYLIKGKQQKKKSCSALCFTIKEMQILYGAQMISMRVHRKTSLAKRKQFFHIGYIKIVSMWLCFPKKKKSLKLVTFNYKPLLIALKPPRNIW